MADLFDGNGLMNLYANPQTAGMLGMAQGLLAASGPSRLPVSMGQAFGSGLQGAQQGFDNSLQMQRGLLQMRAMQGLMGGGDQQAQAGQPGGAAPSYSSLFGPASTAPATMAPASDVGGAAAGSSASGSPGATIFGKTPAEMFRQGMLMNAAGFQGGGDMMRIAVDHDPSLARLMPTDIQKNAAAAFGYGTPEYTNAIRGAVDKEGIVALRQGAPYIRGGQVYGTPGQAPAGYMNVPNGDGTWTVQPVTGGPEAVKSSAAAGSIGKAYGDTGTGYQNGKPVFVNKGVLADQTSGGGPNGGVPGFSPFQNAIRMVESNGNPAAVNPASGAAGDMQVTPTGAGSANPGFGVMPARNNSPDELRRVGADYAAAMQNRYGNDTDAAVAYNWGPQNADKWIAAGRPWKMLPAQTQSYVGQVHAAMQNFSGNGTAQTSVSPELPPGAANAANASQGAPSKLMADAQEKLASSDDNYQQSREALLKMISITNNGGFGDTVSRFMPANVSTRLNSDAAEYQKAHANFVSQQGKALGSGGTDNSRATLNESVPTFDKPQDAKLSGLNDQLNQLDWRHLKRQALNPLYQQGDEKTYTQQSAAFDNAIKPSMMPQIMSVMNMPASPQRTAALQQAIKDPQMKAALDLMVQTGQLK